MYRAGLRVSEAAGLTAAGINWKDGQLRVLGKKKVERVIPLEPWVIDALGAWKKIRPKAVTFFCTLEGRPLQRRYLNAMLERYSVRAGIPRVNPHALRHTFATGLLGDGFNLREVQEILGHAHVSTTQIYTHVNPVALREKVRRRPGPN